MATVRLEFTIIVAMNDAPNQLTTLPPCLVAIELGIFCATNSQLEGREFRSQSVVLHVALPSEIACITKSAALETYFF